MVTRQVNQVIIQEEQIIIIIKADQKIGRDRVKNLIIVGISTKETVPASTVSGSTNASTVTLRHIESIPVQSWKIRIKESQDIKMRIIVRILPQKINVNLDTICISKFVFFLL